jgi:rhodanese-related sulfurtransferase
MKSLVALLLWALASVSWSAPAISADEVATMATPRLLLDVRSAAEFADGHVPGAVNIAHDSLQGNEAVLSGWKDKTVILYCRTGRRSTLAAEVLQKAGFSDVRLLDGNVQGWTDKGFSLEKGR